MSRKRISILGATGSIGRSTLSVIEAHGGQSAYEVVALTGGANAALLAEQALSVGARLAVVADEGAFDELSARLSGTGIEAAAGQEALLDAASAAADLCVSAIAGASGLAPTFAAVRAGNQLALANKESLVCAGPLLRREASSRGVRILPVDSEHNAIFQVFETRNADSVERIILTASGGPFRDWTLQQMRGVTPEQAIAHPNWSMGVGISIDSASMFNKGLELIEAEQLFPVSGSQIEIIVHPQSVIHSMVGYRDGSVLAQLGEPDMRTPIAYALGWPERVEAPVQRLDFAALARLDFVAPDETRFPALRIAREAMLAGGLAPCVMNAAKEVASAAFVARKIGFLDLAAIVAQVLEQMPMPSDAASLEDVLAADGEARRWAARIIDRWHVDQAAASL